jgi:hypothetical protein
MLKMDDAKLPFNTRLFLYALNYAIHGAYIKWSSGPDLKKLRLYVELKIYDKNRRKITGPQCVNMLELYTEISGKLWIVKF